MWQVVIYGLLARVLFGEEKLIGWEGETFDRKAIFGSYNNARNNPSAQQWIETMSWSPRAFVYHNFLSEEECNHVIKLAATQLRRSTVVGDKEGGNVDEIRTSYGMFISRYYDEI
eukprot:TRINITY_DN1848_c1_g1_i2.p1 TRINITY_DN1848_c1_g1~~TRINITY_DN1848_c1_g1_i2.p1  ORF type:complete len:115 (-),score=5.46 TRINITY_DN1848_c1_g1_i2:55-399(-)